MLREDLGSDVREHPKIEVVSRCEAGEILSVSQHREEIEFLLSIGDVQDDLPIGYDQMNRKLRLLVADVVTEFGATHHDISQIIALARELQSATGRVLIHCEAGISRSSAAALIMYSCWFGPGQEAEAMRRVLEQRPIAMPNRRMVEIADRLLDRHGRLLAVLSPQPW